MIIVDNNADIFIMGHMPHCGMWELNLQDENFSFEATPLV